MTNSESMEMYLETVLVLENHHGHAHSVDIANRLGVSKPSVTKAMGYLKEKGLIHKEAYGSITLTKKGKELSGKIYKRHRMITAFLEHSLNLSTKSATDNACKIEHVIDKTMTEAISKYLSDHNIELNK